LAKDFSGMPRHREGACIWKRGNPVADVNIFSQIFTQVGAEGQRGKGTKAQMYRGTKAQRKMKTYSDL
jgi:hypothetical protein